MSIAGSAARAADDPADAYAIRSGGSRIHDRLMPPTVDFETVRAIGLALPGVAESTCYGAPSLEVGGRMFTCLPTHRSAEPGSLGARIDFDSRAGLLAEQPEIYYLTDHYVDWPCVLVRLRHIDRHELRGLLRMAHRFVSTGGSLAPRSRRRGRGRSPIRRRRRPPRT